MRVARQRKEHDRPGHVKIGGNLGGLLAPLVTVYVARGYGRNTGFLVASLVCLLGSALWLNIRLKHPAGDAHAEPMAAGVS